MLYDGDTFEHNGRTFKVSIEHDSDHEFPWEDGDGQGIVSEWTTRSKLPGERILSQDRQSYRYYDIEATMKKAIEEGWNAPPYDEGIKKQKAARAVEVNFEWMRRWCNDQWEYVGVVVTLLDEEGEETDQTASLWGIESDDNQHIEEVAKELADEL